jgi:hypothetical protein
LHSSVVARCHPALGTLTAPRKVVTPEIFAFFKDLKTKCFIGIVVRMTLMIMKPLT